LLYKTHDFIKKINSLNETDDFQKMIFLIKPMIFQKLINSFSKIDDFVKSDSLNKRLR